jgi:hypothetical protein
VRVSASLLVITRGLIRLMARKIKNLTYPRGFLAFPTR